MPRELQSLNALITGGASGLGAVIARRFAQQGVNLSLNGLPFDQEPAKILCAELEKEYNIKATFVVADVSSPEGCAAAVKHTTDTLGSIDIIISNAGWTKFANWDDLEAFSEDEWIKSFKINTMVCPNPPIL